MSHQPRAIDPPQAPNDARLDALLPSEMAAKASDVGARKAVAGLLPTFVLAVLAGAFVALGAAFATTVAAGSAGVAPVRRRPARRRARLLPRPDPGDRRRRRAVHRQHPDGDGLGVARITLARGRAQLGDRLRGQLRRRARDRGPGGPSRGSTGSAATRWARSLMSTALTKVNDAFGRVRPRHPVQRARLPRGLAHLGAHHHRPDPRDRSADRGVRRHGLRALRRQHVLHPGRDADPRRRAAGLLGGDRARAGRLRRGGRWRGSSATSCP